MADGALFRDLNTVLEVIMIAGICMVCVGIVLNAWGILSKQSDKIQETDLSINHLHATGSVIIPMVKASVYGVMLDGDVISMRSQEVFGKDKMEAQIKGAGISAANSLSTLATLDAPAPQP